MQTISSERLEILSGISSGQLQRWSENGILRPTFQGERGSGGRRRFSETDALTAAIMAEFSRRGVQLAHATEAVREAVKQTQRAAWWTSDAANQPVILAYRKNSKRIQVRALHRAAVLSELTKHAGPGFIVDAAEIALPIRKYFRARCVSR